jgi:hypothetical protein
MTKQLFLLCFLFCSTCGLFGRTLLIIPAYCYLDARLLPLFAVFAYYLGCAERAACRIKFTITFDGLTGPSRYVLF